VIEQLIIHIAAAINMRALYPANHPRVVQSVTQILTTLNTLLQERGSNSVTFLIVGEDLVVEQEVFRRASLAQRHFVQALKRRDIERLTLAEGLEPGECHQFIAALAMGETPRSSAHIVLGRVHVAIDEKIGDTTREAKELSTEQLDVVRQAFAQFRKDETLPLGKMEELVWSFIDSLSRTTRAILPLAKLKEHDEYTFIHSVNVSLLVLAQARSYGIQGITLHAFGMAGLLHDIGKLMVPIEVLNFPGKLEGENWDIMKSHAEQGAWFLSEMEGSNPLSIVVAYEHHMRFDGEANYPAPKGLRKPNLASRMTSIADTFDAMSTLRPYQKPKMRATAFQVLRDRAGTFYDPLLVENFVRLVG
jgi:putative nucleotidyltransferase with HDIG domain